MVKRYRGPENARTGVHGHLYRQGGNFSVYRRLPFIRGEGFTPPNQVTYNEINLSQIASFKAKSEVTPTVLAEKGMLHNPALPIALLGKGEVKVALTVRVHRITKSARRKSKLRAVRWN